MRDMTSDPETIRKEQLLMALRNRRREIEKLGWTDRLSELNDIYDMIEAWREPTTVNVDGKDFIVAAHPATVIDIFK